MKTLEKDFRKLRHIVADVFLVPEEEVTLDSSPDSIESWDSVRHVGLLAAVEEAYGIEFTSDELAQVMSVGDLMGLLVQKSEGIGIPT